MSRVDNIYKNMKSTIFSQIPLFIVSFVVRRVFIVVLGEQYLGLNGLFTNILSLLSVAELGFGTLITYSLYRPIATGDREKIKSLMRLYRRAYAVIGVLILTAGFALTPFLDFFVKDMPDDIPYVRLIYALHVLDSGVSYFFSYKASLLFADQKKYVETLIRTYVKLACHIVQLVLLVLYKNYILYIVCLVASSVLTNVWISKAADRRYPYLREKDIAPLSRQDMAEIKRNVGAMVFHRFGTVAVYGTDNILMAKFVSLASVGLYSNYLLITDTLHRTINRLYMDIMASMGDLSAVESDEKKLRAFNNQYFFSAWVFGFCAVCLMHLYNPFITLWLGEEYLFPSATVAVIVVNFYFTAMRKPVTNTKDVMGLFWNDRYAPLFEVPLNLIISILLSRPFGILGILLGTLASTLLVPFWLEPVILYRHGLGRNPAFYFLRFAVYGAVTTGTGAVVGRLCALTPGGLTGFLLKMLICVCVTNLIFFIVYARTEEFGYLRKVGNRMMGRAFKKIKRGQ